MTTIAPYSRANLSLRCFAQSFVDQALSWQTLSRSGVAAVLSFGLIDVLRFCQLPHYESYTQIPTLIFLLVITRARQVYRPLPLAARRITVLRVAAGWCHGLSLLLIATLIHLITIDSLWLLGTPQVIYIGGSVLALTGAISLFLARPARTLLNYPLLLALAAPAALWGMVYLNWVETAAEVFGVTVLILAGAILWARSKPALSTGAQPLVALGRGVRLWRRGAGPSRTFWRDMLVPPWWPLVLLPIPMGLGLQYFMTSTMGPSIAVFILLGLVYFGQFYLPAQHSDVFPNLPISRRTRIIVGVVTGWLAVIIPLVAYLVLRKWSPGNPWLGAQTWLIGAVALPNLALLTIAKPQHRNIFVVVAALGGALVSLCLVQTPSENELFLLGLGWMLLKDCPIFIALAAGANR